MKSIKSEAKGLCGYGASRTLLLLCRVPKRWFGLYDIWISRVLDARMEDNTTGISQQEES